MRRLFHSLQREEEGVAAVEVALMLPFFVLLVFGAIDASNLLIQTHRVEQGLALAGGYLSKSQDPGDRIDEAKELAVTGRISGGQPIVKGWSTADVSVSFRSVAGTYRTGTSGRVVRMATSHSYEGFGLLRGLSGARIRVEASHEERIDL